MESITRLATRRPVAVLVVATAFVILGWTSWSRLPLDLLPDLESPTIVVAVRSGDRPPAEMERVYAEVVEQRLFTVRAIREISQVARTGRLIATVVFDWDADMDFALVEVERAVGPLRSDPDVDEVLVRHFDPRQAPIKTLGLLPLPDGPDLAELRQVARRQMATALERLPGVAEVRVTGGREQEVRVHVDRFRLESQGLTLADLEARLQAANIDINAGTLEERSRVYLVRGVSRFRRLEDVERVVLRYGRDAGGTVVAVRVADVARVELGDRDIDHLVRVDGQEGVGLSIYKEAGANTIDVARQVDDAVAGLRGDLPGIEVRKVADEAALVEEALADVKGAALWGILLSVLVLAVFLRAVGPTIVVASAVPISLLVTVFFMQLAGHSLNLMTLAGLALGVGMLVDNGIVVVESIFRRLSAGEPLFEAVAAGTADVAGAIVSSTLTNIAVFLPIVFVRGLPARLISGLSFSVVVSLLAALVVAMLVLPALSVWLLPRHGARALDAGRSRIERVVHRLLDHPYLVVGAALVATAVAVLLLLRLGTELLPPADPRQFSVRLVGPPGQRVEATADSVGLVEQILSEAAGSDLGAMMSEVGRLPQDDRVLREEQSEENSARIVVRLVPGGKTGDQVVQAALPSVRGLGHLEASWEIGASALARALGTTGPPVVLEISGTGLDDLRRAAQDARDALAGRAELWDVRSSFEGGPPELRVVLDRALADGLGVSLDSVAATLEAALDGRRVTTVSLGDEERDVVLRLPRARRDELLAIPLRTAGGTRITIGDVARIVPEEGAREIFRRDQRRVARVTARVAPDSTYPAAMAAARATLAALELPPGLHPRLAGEEEERLRAFRELGFAGALALLLVLMVLAGTFESLIHPLTVLASLPLALVGVAAILYPLGRPIGVMEMLGLIVLAGVAVNDAILLVDAVQSLMAAGHPVREALARAAGLRLRPIVMTTVCSVLAIVPLALGGGDAARLRSPMALTIVGGLLASLPASLFVIPCVYLLGDRIRTWRPLRRLIPKRS